MILLILWACLSRNIDAIEPQKPNPNANKTNSETIGRIVAIGDLHADETQAKAVFRLAGLTDEKDRWIDDHTIVIQTGDITDRGPDGRETLDLIMRLQTEAEGRFFPLMGNHEAMTLSGDWRYVSAKDYLSFGGEANRRKALLTPGKYRDWLLELNAVKTVGDTLFVHGGISRTHAGQTPEQLSKSIQAALKEGSYSPLLLDEGPLWYRGLMLADEPLACAELKDVLAAQGVKRIVVGHTTQRNGKIASRCNGQLLGIDIGISSHYGANIGFLEIMNTDAKAIYLGNTMDLPDPK